MYFYHVVTGSLGYHGDEALTYSSDTAYSNGSIVSVPLRNTEVVGIVTATVKKPSFPTKKISGKITDQRYPDQSLVLMKWLQTYYPASLGSVARLFLPPSLTKKPRKPSMSPVSDHKQKTPPPLTSEQENAITNIRDSRANTFLLHGETGSGKTRVYMEIAGDAVRQGKSILVLVPEISLTSQLAQDMRKHLALPVYVLHSAMSDAERRTVWRTVHETSDPFVVIGPRSALFLPYHNLGLIVVDEMHDQAYKQEQMPRYHALRVAAKLSSLHKALLILGSATPTVAEYYFANAKGVPLLRLKKQALGDHAVSQISVVDLKNRDDFTRSRYISNPLIKAIGEAMARNEQSLIFLNRRGTARLVLCQNCGWKALCPRCDIPLIYHADRHNLRCHTCGFSGSAPADCPTCGSADIIYKSFGTKAIAEELQKLFPEARIRRFDTDNMKADRFENHYEDIKNGSADILVGTQTITKGLDLPRLSSVGVVTADSSLLFPDYTASERTYQLLAQVIGRVGRGHTARGTAVIQTYNPDDIVIQAAINRYWDVFYAAEIAERKRFFFPPFCHMLKLTIERSTQANSSQAAKKLADSLKDAGLPIQVVGPSPSFVERVQGKYRWQIVIKSKQRSALLETIHRLPSGWSYDIDPQHLL